jgi:hypothetical protein
MFHEGTEFVYCFFYFTGSLAVGLAVSIKSFISKEYMRACYGLGTVWKLD